MKRIAFVTDSETRDITLDDALAVEPLKRLGIETAAVVWDDPRADWTVFDALVLRSCWDYHFKPQAFAERLDRWESLGIPVWNPVDVVRWNMNKTYLRDLGAKGVRVPPTVWVEAADRPDLSEILETNHLSEAVVKPTISGTARDTWRTSREIARDHQEQFARLLQTGDFMIQPFLAEVLEHGEWAVTFFNGRYSHSTLKRAKPGDFRVQWEHGGSVHGGEPPAALIAQAERILETVGRPLLYARVDLIETPEEATLLELELIEPELYLRVHPDAPANFAEAIASVTV